MANPCNLLTHNLVIGNTRKATLTRAESGGPTGDKTWKIKDGGKQVQSQAIVQTLIPDALALAKQTDNRVGFLHLIDKIEFDKLQTSPAAKTALNQLGANGPKTWHLVMPHGQTLSRNLKTTTITDGGGKTYTIKVFNDVSPDLIQAARAEDTIAVLNQIYKPEIVNQLFALLDKVPNLTPKRLREIVVRNGDNRCFTVNNDRLVGDKLEAEFTTELPYTKRNNELKTLFTESMAEGNTTIVRMHYNTLPDQAMLIADLRKTLRGVTNKININRCRFVISFPETLRSALNHECFKVGGVFEPVTVQLGRGAQDVEFKIKNSYKEALADARLERKTIPIIFTDENGSIANRDEAFTKLLN